MVAVLFYMFFHAAVFFFLPWWMGAGNACWRSSAAALCARVRVDGGRRGIF